MKEISAVLLAGGKSSRMGADKSTLTFHGATFLEWQVQKLRVLGIKDIMISGGCQAEEGARVVPDEHPGRGPLGGMHACMKRALHPDCLVLSVDMPRVPAQALVELTKAHQASEAAITLLQHGEKWEPLIGVYQSRLFHRIEQILCGENTAVRHFLAEVGFEVLRWPEDKTLFCNCNTPQDYERLIQGGPLPGPQATSYPGEKYGK